MAKVGIIGLDDKELQCLKERISDKVVAHPHLPRIVVQNQKLLIEDSPGSSWMTEVDKLVYHGIFEDDHDLIAGLALWGGPCLPNPRAMMDCRLRIPCLVRAMTWTKFGNPPRGFASPEVELNPKKVGQVVAKWGNWHCGKNKEYLTEDSWWTPASCLIEDFFVGEVVRVTLIGEKFWQLRLQGDDWKKSIHHPDTEFMEPDEDLVSDTKNIAKGFGLEVVANDYIVSSSGEKYLLEVNHIPNVDQFPEIWEGYCDFVISWLAQN